MSRTIWLHAASCHRVGPDRLPCVLLYSCHPSLSGRENIHTSFPTPSAGASKVEVCSKSSCVYIPSPLRHTFRPVSLDLVGYHHRTTANFATYHSFFSGSRTITSSSHFYSLQLHFNVLSLSLSLHFPLIVMSRYPRSSAILSWLSNIHDTEPNCNTTSYQDAPGEPGNDPAVSSYSDKYDNVPPCQSLFNTSPFEQPNLPANHDFRFQE